MLPKSPEDSLAFCLPGTCLTSTDSFIIDPPFFEGGDIGKLSVCGSANDVAMMGGRPAFINIGFIIEEDFSLKDLKKIAMSIAFTCRDGGIKILSADTKVLPRFSKSRPSIFINTTCIGHQQKPGLGVKNIKHGDALIVSASLGGHGASIFLAQNNIDLHHNLQSDCANLYPMLEPLFASDIDLHAMRDATRGGLAAVLNEWAQESNICIEVKEESLPMQNEVRGVCEILGLDPLSLANEGVCVIALQESQAREALDILRRHPLGRQASIIGLARGDFKDASLRPDGLESGELDSVCFRRVVLKTDYGSQRFLEYPEGELLPRIC